MSLPSSSHSLDNSCTVIYNRTVFSYSSESFQSLKLQANATWEELPMGVPVNGGVCVYRTPLENGTLPSMFIVGGVSDSKSYQGLQRYTFNTRQWDTIIPSDPVLQNRLYHGAVYLNESDSILVYSGTQDQRASLSSQTFTIQASEPFLVSAFQSIASPAISPVLLQWTDSQAVYLGGSDTNKKVMLFDPENSWVDSNITLANPVINTENIKSTIISGDDLTKVLYTFDLSKSPNSVNITVIRNSEGIPIQKARPTYSKGTQNLPQRPERLTAKNWPSYDDALAPRVSRKSCTISKDRATGLVVFTGGSQVNSLAIFDARGNHWEDPSVILGSKELSAPAISASVAISDDLNEAKHSDETKSQLSQKVLGIIIGSVLISAVLIIGLLLFCRSRRAKVQYDKTNNPRLKGSSDEKDGMDFVDREIPDIILEKYSSSPIGDYKQSKKDGDYNNSHHIYKNIISKPISLHKREGEDSPSYLEETRPAPLPNEASRTERRSSGWNRYWSSDNSSPVAGLYSSKSNPYYQNQDNSSHSSQARRNTDSMTLGDETDLYNISSGSSSINHLTPKNALTVDIGGYAYEPSYMSTREGIGKQNRHQKDDG
ncbi:putative pre-mrna splicing factor clf1 [Erysiphe neolycopersici]|uniref:Putative pre-mrna splicing factor clf1 n=1 Tax=Erysiphe neolycopersici TaxID=212602 RepID=A0A420HYN1_9PEZI|nr:putative pre-mrna splicing factor clf1 [Erysiphe neolycopersici]